MEPNKKNSENIKYVVNKIANIIKALHLVSIFKVLYSICIHA